jgi:TorA maturation chaperone TorD
VKPDALDDRGLAELARARARVWDLLARLYVSEPTAELVEGLRSSSLSGLFQQIDESRTEGVARETGEESLDDLVEDYTALFLGPGPHQSPHESVQTSEDAGKGLLWGQVTVEVKAFMEGAGLVLPEETSLIPDHISVELQFLARLAEAEAASWEEQDFGQAKRRLEWQDRFLEEHVAAWVPGFTRRVGEAAATEFWRAASSATSRFVEQMAGALPELIREAEGLPSPANAQGG